MAKQKYPNATWLGNGKPGGSFIGRPFRVVLHTTETEGLPDYTGGGKAPHLTYNPKTRKWYQHTLLDVAARALRNLDGGVQTNRANAIQVELICYSSKSIADLAPTRRLWVGNLSKEAIADIENFLDWCAVEFGIKDELWPGKQALSYAQANVAGFRMTGSQWYTFNGVCGHQHVPENVHWDPGALNWTELMKEDEVMAGWAWNSGAGAPITDLEDADAVFAHQGTFFQGHDVATYLANLGSPDASELEHRTGMLIGAARITEEIMKIRAGK